MYNTAYAEEREYQLKWYSNDRNFVTDFFFFTSANPFIWRISDLKFVAIQDNTGNTYAGNMDLRFLPVNSSVAERAVAVRAVPRAGQAAATVTLNGSKVNGTKQPAARGVRCITQSER